MAARVVVAKITGAKAASDRIRAVGGPPALNRISRALFVAGNMVEVEAAISITNGAVSGKGHVPSTPGEPPNADTHLLDRSIDTVQVEPLRVQVSANAPYARSLEYGTSRMAARPFMAPALAKKRPEIVALITKAIGKGASSGN